MDYLGKPSTRSGSPSSNKVESRPDGTRIVTRPDGTRTETRPDGSRTAVFPDGSSVEVGKDGSITFHDPPETAQPAQTPPQPTDSPAPPSILDSIDEKIVIS
jgi:hypothetical protein